MSLFDRRSPHRRDAVRALAALFVVGALAVGLAGCEHELDTEDLYFACTTQQDCLEGYVCAAAPEGKEPRVCLPLDADVTDADTSACGDTTRDPLNCGACDAVCGQGEACVDGVCTCGAATATNIGRAACGDGEACVDDACTCGDRVGDDGARACANGEACCAGQCGSPELEVCACGVDGASCEAGQGCCDGACQDLGTLDACGACGEACGDGAELCLTLRCTTPVELAAGRAHTCARYDDGRVSCWGSATNGLLGDPEASAERPSPDTVVVGDLRFARLVAGGRLSCGITTSDEIACFGDLSALGESATAEPVIVALPAGATPTDLQLSTPLSGEAEVLCVVADNGIYCGGDDSVGQLGEHDGPGLGAAWAMQPSGPLAVGNRHVCALGTIAGTEGVYCWGDAIDAVGPDDGVADPPNLVTLDGDVLALAAGFAHTCALVTPTGGGDPGVWCWGRREALPIDQDSADPVEVTLAGSCVAEALDAGGVFSCVRCTDGAVQCWGQNNEGQLGRGNLDATDTVAPVVDLDAAHLSLGATHACAADASSGAVSCWGQNDFAQIGANSGELSRSPTPVVVARPE